MSQKTAALSESLAHIDLLPPVIVEETVPYGEVLDVMRRSDRGSVVVTRRGIVAGVFTERDLLGKYALESIARDTPIRELMTPDPVTIAPETTVGEAVELMHSKRVRNLPLVDTQGRPRGLLTVGRVIRYLADHYPAEVVNLPPVLHQTPSAPEGA